MIVHATPTMKPLMTGSEMKPARKPRRSSPASSANAPVTTASAAVSATMSSEPTATSATAAAESAAVADIGPVTRCFELPNSA